MKSHPRKVHHKKAPVLEDLSLVSEENKVESSFPVEQPVETASSPMISGRTIQYLASLVFFILVILSSVGIFLLSSKL